MMIRTDGVRLWLAQRLAGRHGREAGDVLLDRRRVYILPTLPGLVFAAAMFVMLVGSINYGLQLGFLLTFLVASMAVVAMYHTHRNLAQIVVRGHSVDAVFAGDVLAFTFSVGNPSPQPKMALNFAFLHPARRAGGTAAMPSGRRERPGSGTTIDLPAATTTRVNVGLPTRRRGPHACPRLRIATRFPLGLWHAWSYLTPTLTAVVYPAPETNAPPLPLPRGGEREGSGPVVAGGEEFAGIRPYQPGDPQKTIAWRLAAHSDELSVKLFDATAGAELTLDYAALPPAAGVEARLSRLTRWVLMAEAIQVRYALHLPDRRLAVGHGPTHQHQCLEALATYMEAPSPTPAGRTRAVRPAGRPR
jgi:uncharacterized protein (DUF58 family)